MKSWLKFLLLIALVTVVQLCDAVFPRDNHFTVWQISQSALSTLSLHGSQDVSQ